MNSTLNNASDPDSNASTQRKRRKFAPQEKQRILMECSESSVSVVARKYGLATGQIFQWRKVSGAEVSEMDIPQVSGKIDLLLEHRTALAAVRKREKLAELLAERLLADLKSDKANSYNLSCSLSNLANSSCKLLDQRLSLVEKLAELGDLGEPEPLVGHGFDNPEEDVRRAAEAMVYKLVKEKVERDKSERHGMRSLDEY